MSIIPYRNLYKKRSETIERVFADAKEIHGMRYAKHRGLAKVTMELNLLFSCMNLKKFANKLWDNPLFFYLTLITFIKSNTYFLYLTSKNRLLI